jgi:hypothetical protein
MLRKADAYLKKLTENEHTQIFANKHILAYGGFKFRENRWYMKRLTRTGYVRWLWVHLDFCQQTRSSICKVQILGKQMLYGKVRLGSVT